MRQFDGVLDDVYLVFQRRRDVDGGIGNQQWPVIGRHIHQENVADPAIGAQAIGTRDDLTHQLVGVQAAFHQCLGIAGAYQRNCQRCRVMAVRGIDDADAVQVDAEFLGDRADLVFRADEDRLDDAFLKGDDRTFQ